VRLAKTVRLSRLYLPAVCLFLAAAVAGRAYDPFLVQAFRLIAFDTYQRIAPLQYDPAIPVRVVDIDQESLAKHGQWPWPRTVVRDLVERLAEHKAAAIAFDVLFAEADRTSVEQVVKILPGDQAARLANVAGGGPSNDQQFSESLRKSPSVLPALLVNRPGTPPVQKKAGFTFGGDDPKPFLPTFAGAEPNLSILEDAARGLGAFNWLPSRDQVVRRAPMFFRVGDEFVPSLTAEALRVATGVSTYELKASNASGETAFGKSTGVNSVRIGNVVLPLDPDGAVTLRFRASNPAAFIPAWKVLAGGVDRAEIEGKILLIGTSAQGLLDLRATPVDEVLPGVEVHAMALEHILAGHRLVRPDYALGVEQAAILVLGLLLAFVMPRLAPGTAATLGAATFVVVILAGWIAYRYGDLLFDPLYPALALLILTAGITFYIYRQTERQRGEIRTAFGRYLAPEVVADIVADPSRLELGGEVRELSLMFCDVRDFTGISEGLTAAELTQFINELLTPLSDIVLRERGTIDKYMGDAIMAFWNAPLTLTDHAARACRAAIDMGKRMDALNARWQAEAASAGRTFPHVSIGIGVNTGECCVGNLGSEQRFDYSAIGDEVNVTSRLEGLTKFYGLPAIISEKTASEAPSIPVIEVDCVTVKGRGRPTTIYALAETLDCDQATLATLRDLQERFLRAYRAQQWSAAEMLLAEARALGCPTLTAYYDLFASRIATLRTAALTPDWDGTFAMTEK
jgi:adenylate cyclase